MQPKLASFIDCFNELDATFAIITETWLSANREENVTEDLLLGNGIKFWSKSRPPSASGVCHGGVAIAARNELTSMKTFNIINPNNFEILAVSGSVKNIERKFFIIAVYIPPNYTVPKAKSCMKAVYDTIMDIKNRFTDPFIVVAGDFNQWEIGEALEDYVDLWEIRGGPTRGGRTIDRLISNLPEPPTTTCQILPPLESEDNTVSDHNIVCVSSDVTAKKKSVWSVCTFRKSGKKAQERFVEEMLTVDWNNVRDAGGVEEKHGIFQKKLDDLMDKYFPWQKSRKREGDLPWLDSLGKKKIRRKKAIYRDEGKSERWHAACKNLDDYLKMRQESYLESQRSKFFSPDASKQFFKNVKKFSTAEKPKSFCITELRPNKEHKEVANEAASFFNEISQEFRPLQPSEIPRTFERVLPILTVDQIKQRLIEQKKPGSMVTGDIFPKLINPCAASLAVPLSYIFNEIVREDKWPSAWQVEHVTLIPKKSSPTSFADLRNISCTSFFSKVMETFLLQWTMDEVKLKSNQFGGTKGCSTNHMLLNIWQDICSNLEDHRSATVLTSIDYAKAFNRLSFQRCLEAFKNKGASSSVIRLLAAFLTGRVMKVRAGDEWSRTLTVDGGCPQGSILGVFLFNTTTDDLEDSFVEFEEQPLEILQQARNVPAHLLVPPREDAVAVGTQVLVRKLTRIYKYVDDNVISEKINFGQTPTALLNGHPTKDKLAISSQNAFRTIVRAALAKGMKVNNGKTNILCISDPLNHLRKVHMFTEEGERLDSTEEMKVLGFTFSSRPTVHAHVDSIIKKFRQRYWSLRHLKKVGFDNAELVRVYKCNILPLADYAAVIYHSLLTDEQDEQLENAQTSALKCIFNHCLSARKLRKLAGIDSLRKRRIKLTDKFAAKCIGSERFAYLFPEKTSRRSTRNTGEKYVEEFARCDRLRNSPLFYMRRRMNGKEGKTYGERYRIYRET